MGGVVGPSKNRTVQLAFEGLRKEERAAKKAKPEPVAEIPAAAPKKTTKPRKAAKKSR